MKNSDLALRTRARVQGTRIGHICAEVDCLIRYALVSISLGRFQGTTDIYRVYWPETPLPVLATELASQQQRRQPDSGAGIEMLPIQNSVSVNINLDPDSHNE